MSKKENLGHELASELASAEVKTAAKAEKSRRTFTAEDVAQVKAGIELLKTLGAKEELIKMLEVLAPAWHSNDKEELALAKKQNIENFGGIENFKNFVEGGLRDMLAPYAGLVKLIPICNNISSFYARRANKKATFKNVTIGGKTYQVNATYLESLAGRDRAEIRKLVLTHADTREVHVDVVEL